MESTQEDKLIEIRSAFRIANYKRAIKICRKCLQQDETDVEGESLERVIKNLIVDV